MRVCSLLASVRGSTESTPLNVRPHKKGTQKAPQGEKAMAESLTLEKGASCTAPAEVLSPGTPKGSSWSPGAAFASPDVTRSMGIDAFLSDVLRTHCPLQADPLIRTR